MSSVQTRINTIVLLLVLFALLALIGMLANGAHGGPLDPPSGVNPSMRTMEELLPAWNRKLTAVGASSSCDSPRFQCVLPDQAHPTGAAVLDRETGLVWQRVPGEGTYTWAGALFQCTSLLNGGRNGWRTPAVDEITSLFLADDPGPFNLGAALPYFWTTTREPGSSTRRLYVTFEVGGFVFSGEPVVLARSFCVRGGAAHDPQ